MAYKFQLGKAKLSGSVETTLGITSQGGLLVNGDVDLDAGVINTAELADASVTNDKLAGSIASTKIAELNAFDTDDVAEGSSNLYYTDEKARAAVSVNDVSGDGSLSYDSETGVISYTGPSASEVRAHLSAGDGLSFAGGEFAVTSSIAGAGLAWSAGVLSVDTAEIHAGLSGSVEAMIGAFVEGSDFVTFDDGTGTIGVNDVAFTGSARSVINVNTGSAFLNGNIKYNQASGTITLEPVSNTWVRQQFGAIDAIRYNSGSGQISLALTGASLSQSPTGLQVQQGWVRDQFSAGVGLDYSAGVFSVGTGEVTNAMLAGAIENGKLVNSSVTVNGTAGEVTVVGSPLSLGGTATVSLPSTITKDLSFSGQVTINNLNVTGTLTTVNTENLEIKDARILIASGSPGWATDVGFDFGSHVGHATLLTAEADMGVLTGVDSLSSSLPLVAPAVKADTFYGNFVGASILGIITEGASTADISANVTRANAASQVLTLPSAPAVGQEHRIKCVVADASNPVITIQPASGAKLEGVVDAQITLESFGAAVSLVWGGADAGWMVF